MARWWKILGSSCIAAAVLCSCQNDLDKVAAIEVELNAPDRITSTAEYLYSDSGRVTNRLRAGRIAEWSTGERKRTEMSEGVELVFFDRKGEEQSKLTARRGLILPKEKRMEVYEQVVFVNEKGERLETEQLTWYQDSARVRTDKAVRVQRGPDVIHGMGLDAAEDFSSYVIHRITGQLYVPDDTLATDAQAE
ncbi:MAG: LPS export ABC transporter periplasmic protein LptC [Flavobacteriales bacterium]|jgi:LPS export ABC transporter protein LptC|nr:LPS export ABC transporter periplasmic protein LptC [Flavobacteriales bacterium]